MKASPAVNRGPSAAAANRAALIFAAREVLATNGFDAPLSLIARKAGVGQGSLYRHFPDRASIARAVFEDDVAEWEALAAHAEATLDDIVAKVVERLIASVALIALIDPKNDDERLLDLSERVRTLFRTTLKSDGPKGAIRDDVTAEDLLMALAMLGGVLARTDPSSRPDVAARAWALLVAGLGR